MDDETKGRLKKLHQRLRMVKATLTIFKAGNPNHDEKGKFSSADSAGGKTSKPRKGKKEKPTQGQAYQPPKDGFTIAYQQKLAAMSPDDPERVGALAHIDGIIQSLREEDDKQKWRGDMGFRPSSGGRYGDQNRQAIASWSNLSDFIQSKGFYAKK